MITRKVLVWWVRSGLVRRDVSTFVEYGSVAAA